MNILGIEGESASIVHQVGAIGTQRREKHAGDKRQRVFVMAALAANYEPTDQSGSWLGLMVN